MGDLASDHDAAIQLIIGEYHRICSHNKDHELLQYISNVTQDGFEFVKDKYLPFLERFETEEDKKGDVIRVAKVLTAYFIALRRAADEIEGIKKPEPPLANITPVKILDEIEDMPF